MKINRALLAIMAIVLAALDSQINRASDGNWPQFLGPGCRAVSSNAQLPDRWSETENVEWKTEVPGRCRSSAIVWGNRVFLTTAIGADDSQPVKKGPDQSGALPTAAELRWKVLCLDLLSGKVLWERDVYRGAPPGPTHAKNSYASETPVTDGQRVYAYFGNVGVFCLDWEGRPLWSKRIAPHAMMNGWGTASSPALHHGRLYLVNDNNEQSYLLALDAHTGKELWRVDREEKSNWSTPYVWENPQRTEIVTPGTGKVRAYDLEGKLLWWFQGMSGITIATPYADGGLLYVSSDFVRTKQRPVYAIRPGAAGDISLKPGETSNSAIAWTSPTAAPYVTTTLVYDGRLYVLNDRGLLGALDSRTGKPLFEPQRLPGGRRFSASPWAYNGQVFCLNEEGVTFVVRAGDRFDLLRQNTLADDNKCLATPAMAGDRLLIRTSSRIYCIRKSPSNH